MNQHVFNRLISVFTVDGVTEFSVIMSRLLSQASGDWQLQLCRDTRSLGLPYFCIILCLRLHTSLVPQWITSKLSGHFNIISEGDKLCTGPKHHSTDKHNILLWASFRDGRSMEPHHGSAWNSAGETTRNYRKSEAAQTKGSFCLTPSADLEKQNNLSRI